jgi:ribosome-associated protein
MTSSPRVVPIRDQTIRLGQLLKLADLVEDGGEAKAVLAQGLVRVNGEVETRRGRQVGPGDRVELGGDTVVIGTVGIADAGH